MKTSISESRALMINNKLKNNCTKRSFWCTNILLVNNNHHHQPLRTLEKSSFFHIKNIRCMRNCLSNESAAIVSHVCITNKLDYCNLLLYGPSDFKFNIFFFFLRCSLYRWYSLFFSSFWHFIVIYRTVQSICHIISYILEVCYA